MFEASFRLGFVKKQRAAVSPPMTAPLIAYSFAAIEGE